MTKHSSEAEALCPAADAACGVHEAVLGLLRTDRVGRLLDAPAGEGAFAFRARDLGHEVSCADIAPARFRCAGLECRQMDLNRPWPFDSERFDHVVSIEAVEHLENPWHLMREANRVLRPEGKLIVTTPNVLSIRSRLSNALYGYPNYFHYMIESGQEGQDELPVDHINPVGFLELRHVLSRTGFGIERICANRLVKHRSVLYRFIKRVLQTRGKTQGRHDPAKAQVRDWLLSDPLLFGEILIIKAAKRSGLDSSKLAKETE